MRELREEAVAVQRHQDGREQHAEAQRASIVALQMELKQAPFFFFLAEAATTPPTSSPAKPTRPW